MVAKIERSMTINVETGVVSANYPWKPCVMRMQDNRRQVEKVQQSMEKHMVKSGTHADYVEEMKKAIGEGKVRRITEDEMTAWHGPVHYITTFGVVKPESVSTRMRIVSNAALRNSVSHLSLNDCMWPGPNALCDLLDCLIFWRAVKAAIMMDLRKAYNTVHTSDKELHLRRFLFRERSTDP